MAPRAASDYTGELSLSFKSDRPDGLGDDDQVRIINLAMAPGERSAWDRPKWVVYLWSICELLVVTNPWQVSSGIRVLMLRLFGAEIGHGVIFRPRTRVKFPWKLHIGDRSWIGEGVWLHNQDHVYVGNDVVLSQEAFITTGSHAHRDDMALVTKPVIIEAGAWLTTRTLVLGGSRIGLSALISPNSVVGPNQNVPANTVAGGNPCREIGPRFRAERTGQIQEQTE